MVLGAVLGVSVGAADGKPVGVVLGADDGECEIEGAALGWNWWLGASVGARVGIADGVELGARLGFAVGAADGNAVGVMEGAELGEAVSPDRRRPSLWAPTDNFAAALAVEKARWKVS